MRPAPYLLLVTVLLQACSGGAPAAPSPTPAAGPPAPAYTRIFLSGADQLSLNAQRQFQVWAMDSTGSPKNVTSAVNSWVSSNPEIASVSSAGVVTGLKLGNARIKAAYGWFEGFMDVSVYLNYFRPPDADGVTGYVRDENGMPSLELSPVEVEVVGGPSAGRRVETTITGFFRIDGLQAPGFDLMARRRGYATARVHVAELGREVSINLAVAPGVFRDVLEGDVCYPIRTITRTFTPTEPGFLRITVGGYPSTTSALYGDDELIKASVTRNEDVELQAGVKYELRVTGTCASESLSTRGIVIFLRPYDQ